MGVKGVVASSALRTKVNNNVPQRVSNNETFKGGLQNFSGQFGKNFEQQPRGTSMDDAKRNALMSTATSEQGMSALGQMGRGALEEGGKYLGEQAQQGASWLRNALTTPQPPGGLAQ